MLSYVQTTLRVDAMNFKNRSASTIDLYNGATVVLSHVFQGA